MSKEKQEAKAWLESFHDMSQKLDAEAWLSSMFTPDITLKFGNTPVLSGSKVLEMFQGAFAALDVMVHDIDYFDVVDDRIYQAATIHYVVKGDDPGTQMITIPGFMTVWRRHGSDGKLRAYRAETFLDFTPVASRIAEKFSSGGS